MNSEVLFCFASNGLSYLKRFVQIELVSAVLHVQKFDILEWSEAKSVELARRFGYFGLAIALSVPFFPDTISIYAFAVLEEDYVKFALATFVGSIGRLLVTTALIGGALFIY